MRKLFFPAIVALLTLMSFGISFAAPINLPFNKSIAPEALLYVNAKTKNCAYGARALTAGYPGSIILSIEEKENYCVVIIRVNGKNGAPPRIIRKKIPATQDF